MNTGWNHNIHYHDLILHAVPSPCDRALDAGCGQGLLTRQLATHAKTVVGIDLDLPEIPSTQPNTTFVQGDIMTHPFPPASFDFIAAVATLHHLPLGPALTRFRDLLAPGGVLAIVGLYRATTFADYALAAAALPLSHLLHLRHGTAEVQARIHIPSETLHDIQTAATLLLPCATLRRHLFHRYTLLWHKPGHPEKKSGYTKNSSTFRKTRSRLNPLFPSCSPMRRRLASCSLARSRVIPSTYRRRFPLSIRKTQYTRSMALPSELRRVQAAIDNNNHKELEWSLWYARMRQSVPSARPADVKYWSAVERQVQEILTPPPPAKVYPTRKKKKENRGLGLGPLPSEAQGAENDEQA